MADAKDVAVLKAAFKEYMEDYAKKYKTTPSAFAFNRTTPNRCCGAIFLSGMNFPRSAIASWMDQNYQQIWFKLTATQVNTLLPYCYAKFLQFYAKFNDSERPLMFCITSDYQEPEEEGLRKAGWKRAPSVQGNSDSMLTVWTKDARDWKVLTK